MNLLTVLHPRHKLEYFRKAHWPEDWIAVAKKIVRDEYEHTYKVTEGELEVEDVQKVNGILHPITTLPDHRRTIALDFHVAFNKYIR